jgi:flagellar hook-associated protein 3 FlgL
VRADSISTLSLLGTPRSGAARMQTELVRLTSEITTARFADVGLELGAATGTSAKLHIDTAALTAIADSNAAAAARLSATKAALDAVAADADAFLEQLILSRDGGTWSGAQAAAGLASFTAQLNTAAGGVQLFGGINSAVRPITDFDSGPKAAAEAAFLARFGVGIGDPAAADIDAADMADFLDTDFAALFADPEWATWSSASDQAIRSRISPGETVDTSVSANQTAMRKLAMVYTMTAGLGAAALGAETRQTVADKAIALLGEAVADLTALRSTVDVTLARVNGATDRVELQRSLIESRIASFEGVDPAEAKTRLDALTTQIEMSYSLTAQLLKLSILNYV